MARNTELLERVMQHITDHPEQHNQSMWVNECGTAACFAGWATLLSGWYVQRVAPSKVVYVAHQDDLRDFLVNDLAVELLGITNDEADVLFGYGNSREMLQLMVKDLVNGDALREPEDYFDSSLEMNVR